ncbi:putative pentatricopeptide repeat-containing protein [Hordeum vulgare]|nr:putative pentatricopeptide repeat-containing protein [Hordeum vulgare]
MPPAPAYAVLASAFRTRNPICVHRWLAVFDWCMPAIRQNVSEVLPDAILPPGFRPSIVPRGYVLGSPRLCHTSASGDSLDVRVGEVLRVLKSCDADADLSKDLCRFADEIDRDVVLEVLQKQRSNWQVALLFFTWAAGLPTYEHGPRTYIEMLDILGRMKKVRLMRQLFDEIPEQRRGLVVTNMMFAVLLNRYAGAHKVQETIEIFYKRNDYGFEVDLVGFQILLMSLCRYKDVEEAEALFLQKKDEFPLVIKSRNIILNGWCVKGSLPDAKRVWNEIIASKFKPDLFTYEKIARVTESELKERMRKGVYGEIYNFPFKQFDTILDMEKDELAPEIEEEEVRQYRLFSV